MTDAMLSDVISYLQVNPFASLRELAGKVCGGTVSKWTVGRRLSASGMSFKKPSKRFAEIDRDSVEARRIDFLQWIQQQKHWPLQGRIASVDEISFHENDLRGRVWCKRGMDCPITIPANRGARFSVICAITENGLIHFDLVNGSMKADNVVTFLQALKQQGIHTVVLDNAAIHRAKNVQNAHSIPVLQFLPPYSPDLAPVEFFFRAFRSRFHRQCVSKCFQPLNRALQECKAERQDWTKTFIKCWRS